jgi:hypothetical protein
MIWMTTMTDDLEKGRHGRDAGMELAGDAEGEEFSRAAFEAICRVASRQATLFVDDVLLECSLRPRHFNAWGGVWMRAIRRKIIVNTGTTRQSHDPLKHAHRYPIYRSLICEGSSS